MNRFVRRGFTLVELLIAIVVIGVLAAMMMFSSSEAITTANATAVINNLDAIKRAGLAYYADNMETINKDPVNYKPSMTDSRGLVILKYLDNSPGDAEAWAKKGAELKKDGYDFYYGFYGDRLRRWYVGYTISDPKIKAKLAGRAKSLKLLGQFTEKETKYGYSYQDGEDDVYDGTQDIIYLRIR